MLAQVALAAIEDGGDHRLGVTHDKRVTVQGREGAGESLAIGAVAIGAIVLKDFLALLDEVAGCLGPGAPTQERQARQDQKELSFCRRQPQGRSGSQQVLDPERIFEFLLGLKVKLLDARGFAGIWPDPARR